MRKRIAAAIGVTCLAAAVLVGCAEGSSTSAGNNGDGYEIDNGNDYVYTTTVKVNGKTVNCVVMTNLNGIDCDWAGATEASE